MGSKGDFTSKALAAQKAAASVLGKADRLLLMTRAILEEREAELLELAGPCSNSDCRLHANHRGPCIVPELAAEQQQRE